MSKFFIDRPIFAWVIALVIIAVTWLRYQNSMRSLRQQTLDSLNQQVSARTQFDSEAFIQAEQNT